MKCATSLLILFTALTPSLAQTLAQNLNERWELGNFALQARDLSKAASAFESWVQLASQSQIHSAEAHLNLASIYWKNEQGAPAISELLKGATLRNSILDTWKDLNLISDLQGALGVREPLSDSLLWRMSWILSPNVIAIWTTVLIWIFLLMAFLKLGLIPARKIPWLLWAVQMVWITLGVGLAVANTLSPQSAILQSSEGTVTIYRDPKLSDEGKLIELPNGVLVTVLERYQDFTHIQEPITGWVPTSALQLLPGLNP